MKIKQALLFVLLLVFSLIIVMFNVKAEGFLSDPTIVEAGVWLVNVEKVDLSASSYRLDFYIWFRFNPSKISLEEVKEFEFVNGFPLRYEVKMDADNGYLEYRVRGDFIKTFDFSRYPL
ncbi:MAG: hypothetical protein QW702_07115 [Candidatus Bathyarchaeia archaeon]